MAQVEKAVFVQDGDEGIDYTPNADVAAGDVIDLGTFVGIARHPITAGETGALDLFGVYSFLKETGAGINVGDKVVWDSTSKVAFVTGGGYSSAATVGVCIKAAGSSDATVWVLVAPWVGVAGA